MKIPLQTWYDAWLKENLGTNLIYAQSRGKSNLPHVHFVRDVISDLVWRDIKYIDRIAETERPDCKITAYVISEHHSKSVRLPVFSIDRPDLGLQIVLRDNYYNWNVSVIAGRPTSADLRGFVTDFDNEKERAEYQPHGYWGYCFFEGFPTDLMFGPHSMDPGRFSLWVNNDYELYSLVRNLMLDYRNISTP